MNKNQCRDQMQDLLNVLHQLKVVYITGFGYTMEDELYTPNIVEIYALSDRAKKYYHLYRPWMSEL